MKRIVAILTVLFTFVSFSSIVQASEQLLAEARSETPTILILLTGSAKSYNAVDKTAYELTTQKLLKTFESYNLLIDGQYKQRLEDNGTPDAISMDRSDLLSIYADVKPDYIMIFEFLPWTWQPSVSTVHLKVIDTALDKYLSNKKFSYRSNRASIKGHYSEIYLSIESEVFSKHFPLANITPKQKDELE